MAIRTVSSPTDDQRLDRCALLTVGSASLETALSLPLFPAVLPTAKLCNPVVFVCDETSGDQ